jgi:hypothetical protein
MSRLITIKMEIVCWTPKIYLYVVNFGEMTLRSAPSMFPRAAYHNAVRSANLLLARIFG